MLAVATSHVETDKGKNTTPQFAGYAATQAMWSSIAESPCGCWYTSGASASMVATDSVEWRLGRGGLYQKSCEYSERNDSVPGSPRNQMDGPNRLPTDRHCIAQVYSGAGDADNSHCQISHNEGCSEAWENMFRTARSCIDGSVKTLSGTFSCKGAPDAKKNVHHNTELER